jgi:uncharacterized membrane protein AbrB (regulator of aidB expression)
VDPATAEPFWLLWCAWLTYCTLTLLAMSPPSMSTTSTSSLTTTLSAALVVRVAAARLLASCYLLLGYERRNTEEDGLGVAASSHQLTLKLVPITNAQ